MAFSHIAHYPLLYTVAMMLGGSTWMNWCLYAAVLIAFPLMLKFREQYRRLMVDKGRVVSPMSVDVSSEHSNEVSSTPHDA